MECKVHSVNCLGSHDKFLAEIVGVYIKRTYLDEHGKLDPLKADFISYMGGHYFGIGKYLGQFGLSVQSEEDKNATK